MNLIFGYIISLFLILISQNRFDSGISLHTGEGLESINMILRNRFQVTQRLATPITLLRLLLF